MKRTKKNYVWQQLNISSGIDGVVGGVDVRTDSNEGIECRERGWLIDEVGADSEGKEEVSGGFEFRNRCGKRKKFVGWLGWYRWTFAVVLSLKCGLNKTLWLTIVDGSFVSTGGEFNELFTKINGPLWVAAAGKSSFSSISSSFLEETKRKRSKAISWNDLRWYCRRCWS